MVGIHGKHRRSRGGKSRRREDLGVSSGFREVSKSSRAQVKRDASAHEKESYADGRPWV